MNELKLLLLAEKCTIKEALELLDKNAQGIVFVIDKNQTILGVITDGDIRRALLQGKSLDENVTTIMNNNFTSLPIDATSEVILQHISNKIKIIPLVDNDNRVVDYASIKKVRPISIASPVLSGNELAYVTECIRTNWISSQGKFVRLFESMFSDIHSGHSALAVSNGTVALHLALVTINIGAGDEVIVPDLTFVASINAILYTGATPVLADIDPLSLNIDVTKIENLITSKTKAIMPVHLYGNPCDMVAIMNIAKKHNLLVIEDAAEALGSLYNAKPVGTFGDVATFSFFGNKTITTGEGGMIVFKNPEVAQKATMLRDHGMNKSKRYWHDEVGYNYRLTNIQAAIGVAQLERLDEFVAAKRNIAHQYNNSLKDCGFFQLPQELNNTHNSYWLYTVIVKENAPFIRNEIMAFLDQLGIETRPVFYPAHEMPPYVKFGIKENLTNSTKASYAGFSLPSAVSLSNDEIDRVCKALQQFILKFC
jgi:perosamine synthetase